MIKKFLAISLIFLGIQNSFCQSKKYFDKELRIYENYIVANEQDVGRFLSWRDFKQRAITTWGGEGESTMLLGSATYLYDFLKDKYPDFKAVVVKPKSQWQIRFDFNGTSIDLFKRLQLKRQWRDQFAYQKPDNYWVAYGFDQNDSLLNDALNVLLHYYKESNIQYQSNIEITESLKKEVIESPKNGNEYATIYFYNAAPFYNSVVPGKYEVKLDDSTIYELQRDNPAAVKVYKEGDYVLSARTGELTELNLHLEKGRDYYIRCGIYKASFFGKPKLHQVIEYFARDEYEACVERFEVKKSKD